MAILDIILSMNAVESTCRITGTPECGAGLFANEAVRDNPALEGLSPETIHSIKMSVVDTVAPILAAEKCPDCPIVSSCITNEYSGTAEDVADRDGNVALKESSLTPEEIEQERKEFALNVARVMFNTPGETYFAATYGRPGGSGGYMHTGAKGWREGRMLTRYAESTSVNFSDDIGDTFQINGNRGHQWKDILPTLSLWEGVVLMHSNTPSVYGSQYKLALTLAFMAETSRDPEIQTFTLWFNNDTVPEVANTLHRILNDPTLMVDIYRCLFPTQIHGRNSEVYNSEKVSLRDTEKEVRMIP